MKLFLTFALTFLLGMRTTFAMPEIMPLEKVQSGMNGVAYTVVDQSGAIEPFDVKIIGLMDNGKGSSKMIMAEASGSVIDKTGGVLQGMSGSPVYIDGKLVGALSAGIKEMNPRTFFITPIENMLKIWDLPDIKEFAPPVQLDEKTDETETDSEVPADEEKSAEEKSVMFFSGFDSSGLKFLEREMKPFGFENFFVAAKSDTASQIKYNATIKPGAAMGVAVVYGDFLVGATGTVTAVDGNRILGFGHPFSHGGNVNYFMTDASVIAAVNGVIGNGMKISSVGNIIGRINQDRESGVAGILGNFPSTVPINVTIKDETLDKTETYSANIAYNENLLPKLGAAIAYSAFNKTADETAEATVAVDFGIKTNAVEDGNITRQNVFYSTADVGQQAITELLQALTLVCSNTTEESAISGIDVNMTLNRERQTASLVSAFADKKRVKPGETVNLVITLQPYRKPEDVIVVPYTVPLNQKEGPLVLDLHGGALVPVVPANTNVVKPSTGTPKKIFDDKIKKLISANKNNQLIIELGAASIPKTQKEILENIKRAKKAQERFKKLGIKPPTPANNKVDTKYIIDNVIQVTINVDKI
ncbi:MAG: SpoIVB peptidase S55 domain protein [Selenomonadaceae bacterium]|nr:SpoIVB peptidase S55 domain protein [Selenomonadaceae bacterium]